MWSTFGKKIFLEKLTEKKFILKKKIFFRFFLPKCFFFGGFFEKKFFPKVAHIPGPQPKNVKFGIFYVKVAQKSICATSKIPFF